MVETSLTSEKVVSKTMPFCLATQQTAIPPNAVKSLLENNGFTLF